MSLFSIHDAQEWAAEDAARTYRCEGCGWTGIPNSCAIPEGEKLVHVEDMGTVFDGKYVPYPISCGPLVEETPGA